MVNKQCRTIEYIPDLRSRSIEYIHPANADGKAKIIYTLFRKHSAAQSRQIKTE